jgi:hypothetical protein
MLEQIVIAIIALLFQGVCVGIVPERAQKIAWNNVDGYALHGPVYDYGFHTVANGSIRVVWSLQYQTFVIMATTNPPDEATQEWHTECHAFYFPAIENAPIP